MIEANTEREHLKPVEPSPLTMPPARQREPSADDMEIDVSDPINDVPLDDTERLREDADPAYD
jgi:hypothetical protein